MKLVAIFTLAWLLGVGAARAQGAQGVQLRETFDDSTAIIFSAST